jgi:hypothetical protein
MGIEKKWEVGPVVVPKERDFRLRQAWTRLLSDKLRLRVRRGEILAG